VIFKSPIFSQASGSIGGTVFSHNRGGMYTRNRTIPTNPNTGLQTVVRNAMVALATRWADVLSAAQRAAWSLYGANVAMTNKLGDTVYLTGQQHFVRSNIPRIQGGLAIVDDGPTVFNLGTFNPFSITTISASSGITIGYDDTDAWCDLDGAGALLYFGKSVSPGINFYPGPFKFNETIEGDSMTPPSAPYLDATPCQVFSEGNKAWIAVRVSQDDGRLSEKVIIGPSVITS